MVKIERYNHSNFSVYSHRGEINKHAHQQNTMGLVVVIDDYFMEYDNDGLFPP
jgi:hypothetical protein